MGRESEKSEEERWKEEKGVKEEAKRRREGEE